MSSSLFKSVSDKAMKELPEEVLNGLGSDLLEKINKWQALKLDIDLALKQVERGEVSEMNMKDIIAEAKAENGL